MGSTLELPGPAAWRSHAPLLGELGEIKRQSQWQWHTNRGWSMLLMLIMLMLMMMMMMMMLLLVVVVVLFFFFIIKTALCQSQGFSLYIIHHTWLQCAWLYSAVVKIKGVVHPHASTSCFFAAGSCDVSTCFGPFDVSQCLKCVFEACLPQLLQLYSNFLISRCFL